MMFIDAGRELLGHLTVAMRRHRNWAATQGVQLPRGWSDLESAVTARATEGQLGTSVDALWELGESRVINPMLLTYEEVATAMSCSTRHVKRLAADGTLPSVAVGSLTRVRVVDLDAYVAELPAKREAS